MPHLLCAACAMQMSSCGPIRAALALLPCMDYPEREPRSAELQPAASVFVLRPGSEPPRRPESTPNVLDPRMRIFFLLFYRWMSSLYSWRTGSWVLMDGVAWIPSVTQWRWTLAFVNWGISLYRFCPLCLGRRVHPSGLTIGIYLFIYFCALSCRGEICGSLSGAVCAPSHWFSAIKVKHLDLYSVWCGRTFTAFLF